MSRQRYWTAQAIVRHNCAASFLCHLIYHKCYVFFSFELLDLQGLMALTSPVCSLSLFLFVLSPLFTFSHACLTPELHVSDARWLSPPTCWVFTVILFVAPLFSLCFPLTPTGWGRWPPSPSSVYVGGFFLSKQSPTACRYNVKFPAIIAVVNWHFRNRNELRGKKNPGSLLHKCD